MTVLESIRGHDNTVAHAFMHTGGRCPQCNCDQLLRAFCWPDSEAPMPRIRGCELGGAHLHLLCAACKYPFVERTMDQAIHAEAEGTMVAESEMSAVLAAVAARTGGLSLDRVLVSNFRGWTIRFVRDPLQGTLVVTAEAPVPQGAIAHPDPKDLEPTA